MGLSKIEGSTVGVGGAAGVERMEVGTATVETDTSGVAGCPEQLIASRQTRSRNNRASRGRSRIMDLYSPSGKEKKSHQVWLMALPGNPKPRGY